MTALTTPIPADIIEFDPDLNRWGHVWSVFVPGTAPGSSTTFRPMAPMSRNAAIALIPRPG